MSIQVFPYIPSIPVKHTLQREILESTYADGWHIHGTQENTIVGRSDGSGNSADYKGLNKFTIRFNRYRVGSTIGDGVWSFLMQQLDNLNEPFYFYNPQEYTPPDLSGIVLTGRYLVKLADPNQVLNRTLFGRCMYSYDGIELIETNDDVSTL